MPEPTWTTKLLEFIWSHATPAERNQFLKTVTTPTPDTTSAGPVIRNDLRAAMPLARRRL